MTALLSALLMSSLSSQLAVGGDIRPTPGVYETGDAVTVPASVTRLSGYGTTLVQHGQERPGLVLANPNTVVEGLRLVAPRGGKDWKDAERTGAIGVMLRGADGSTLRDLRLEGWGCEAINVQDSAGVRILDTDITGIGKAGGLKPGSNLNTGVKGYLSGLKSAGLLVRGCSFTELAQGINLDHDWLDVTIEGCRFADILGQHGVYANTIRGLVVNGCRFRNIAQAACKVQTHRASVISSGDITFTGNNVQSCGQIGFGAIQATGTRRFRGLLIASNLFDGCVDAAIDLAATDDWRVESNLVLRCKVPLKKRPGLGKGVA